MPILNYTTKVDVEKTVSEISKMLSKAGAKAILTEYHPEGYVEALSFRINLNGNDIGFRLPTDWKPILLILENDRKVPRSMTNQTQAVRVAWRIIKDWIEAQLALIETRMVTTEQVFLPYAITKSGNTLYEAIKENPTLMLGTGKN